MSDVAGTTTRPGQRRAPAPVRWIAHRWPTLLGLATVAGTAIGMTSGVEAGPVIAAALAIYAVAAAFGRRWAWPAFIATVPIIGISRLVDWQPVPFLLVLGAVAAVIGIARRRWRPWDGVPLQSAVLVVLGALALVGLSIDSIAGGVLVAVTLLAHAGGDVWYLIGNRVVPRSMAELCCVLDAVLAVVVLVVTLGV